MDLVRLYIDRLPDYLLSWKLYSVLALCLGLEAIFFVRVRPLLSVGLAQDFVFGLCKRWLLLPITIASATLYMAVYGFVLPPGEWQIAREWPLWAQVVAGFLTADFAVYASHVMLHKVGLLWQFHAVHHSQRNINPLTTHRSHFVEDLFEDAVQFLPLAVLGVGYSTWIGVRAFNWLWVHLIHSNLRWNLGPLGWILVSPQHHRLHHSIDPRHHDRNFATRLVIWDRIFGTFHPDRSLYPETGIPDTAYPLEVSAHPLALLAQVGRQYAHPFRVLLGTQRRMLRSQA